MEGYDAVVHLSGANLAQGRWTKSRKQILRNSRVDTTRVLVDALARLQKKPSVFICASGVGYYGSRGDEILTEGSGNGNDFLGMTCRAWEAEATRANSIGIRTVIARFGVILSPHGGALPTMAAPFRLGLGARLGSGKQWMSWITLQDVVAILRCAIDVPSWSGAYNVVAPSPIQNADFTRVLAGVLHRPAFFAAPASPCALPSAKWPIRSAPRQPARRTRQTPSRVLQATARTFWKPLLFDILGKH